MTRQAQLLAGSLAARRLLAVGDGTPDATGETPTDVIRAFIVDSVGEDTGDDMTEQAEQLRQQLAAAGLLADGVHEPVPFTS